MPQITQYPRMPRWPYWKFGATGGAPEVVNAPHVSGNGIVGDVLSSTLGNWTNEPTTYTHQWLRAGVAIPGALSSTYTLVAADVGNNIACEVTAINSFGTGSAISNEIAVVATSASKF